MTAARVKSIEESLRAALDPVELMVKDQSQLHAGHEGAADGRGHFDVRIVAAAFEGKSRIARHRMIYDALGALLETDIHALRITAVFTASAPAVSEAARYKAPANRAGSRLAGRCLPIVEFMGRSFGFGYVCRR